MSAQKIVVLTLEHVTKTICQGEESIKILKDINLQLFAGEAVALVGPSGAGKSTLLQISGLLDSPTSGKIIFNNKDCSTMSDQERTNYRRNHAGFIYQFHHLLSEFTALENVIIPLLIKEYSYKKASELAIGLLNTMGLSHRISHRPYQLSGGEQQRVAVARALINQPQILFADEPTGNLDPETAAIVFAEMLKMVKNAGCSALIATHDLNLAAKMDRTLYLSNGKT